MFGVLKRQSLQKACLFLEISLATCHVTSDHAWLHVLNAILQAVCMRSHTVWPPKAVPALQALCLG